jgi:hypothetical protein
MGEKMATAFPYFPLNIFQLTILIEHIENSMEFQYFFSQDSIDFPLKGSRWRGTNPSVSGFGHVVFS